MIALGWNCRGLGNPATIPFLCELVRARKPNFIFLCETLSSSFAIESIRVRLGYDCAFTVDCHGHSGGLCFLWKDSATCNILNYSQNHIDVLVSDSDGDWRFTGFYGHPERGRR